MRPPQHLAKPPNKISPSARCGPVAGQLLNIKLRALEIERKFKEADELEARMEP